MLALDEGLSSQELAEVEDWACSLCASLEGPADQVPLRLSKADPDRVQTDP